MSQHAPPSSNVLARREVITLAAFESAHSDACPCSIDLALDRWDRYNTEWRRGQEFSTLFSSRHYASHWPTDAFDRESPLAHYLAGGWRLVSPHTLFDNDFYLSRWTEIPIVGYATAFLNGRVGTRSPSGFFDAGFYSRVHEDIRTANIDPFVHFVRNGGREGRTFHPFLDLAYVREQLQKSGVSIPNLHGADLLSHIIEFNLLARANPAPVFSNSIYSESARNLCGPNAFLHFVNATTFDGCGNANGLFDLQRYISDHPNIDFRYTNPLTHLLCFAQKHVETNGLISWREYLETNPDIARYGGPGLQHFVCHGFGERRFVSAGHRYRYAELLRSRSSSATENLEPEVTAVVLRRPSDPNGFQINTSLEILREPQVDALTVDFWDTLVLRRSTHWAAKVRSSERITGLFEQGRALELRGRNNAGDTTRSESELTTEMVYRMRVQLESEDFVSDRESVFADVIARLFTRIAELGFEPPASFDIARELDTLRQIELEFEVEFSEPNIELIRALVAHSESGRCVAIISDFYHDASYLQTVLKRVLGASPLSGRVDAIPIVSSCDAGCSKHRGGLLFDHCRALLRLSAQASWLHVGDSIGSDVRPALDRGLLSIHLDGRFGSKSFAEVAELSASTPEAYATQTIARARTSIASRSRFCSANSKTLDESSTPRDRERAARIRDAGFRYAIMPTFLVLAALTEATRRQNRRVLYLSREGEFLARVHQALAERFPSLFGGVAATHLHSSRRALFSPAFAASPSIALRAFTSQYPTASIATLVRAMLPPAELTKRVLGELANLQHANVAELDQHDLTNALSKELHSTIARYAKGQLASFKRYIATRGTALFQQDEIIADVGWRGTMQDLLGAIFTEHRIGGVYLGMFPFYFDQDPRLPKRGVAFDANRGDAFTFVDPPAAIERPWTPNVGSCIGYGPAGEPQLDQSDLSSQSESDIRQFQNACIELVPTSADALLANGVLFDGKQQGILSMIREYYETPHPGIADIWFDSKHDDTFGLGFNPYAKELPEATAISEQNILYLISKNAEKSRWPAGYHRWSPVMWLETLLR